MTDIIKYPKIPTLYDRDPVTFKVIPGQLRRPEFGLINTWVITEKIHGTNIRVSLSPNGDIELNGRTDRAQIPNQLVGKFLTTFTEDVMYNVFDRKPDTGLFPQVVLFMEGYGEKIQKGGGNYRKGVSFRIFDIWIDGWWLNISLVRQLAESLGVKTVPLGSSCINWLPNHYNGVFNLMPISKVAKAEADIYPKGFKAEGIVARTEPLLFDRKGDRVMWKLKFRDFPND